MLDDIPKSNGAAAGSFSGTKKKYNFRKVLAILFILIIIPLSYFLARSILEDRELSVTERAELMGTEVFVTVNGPNARSHARAAIALMKKLERSLNWKDPQSEVGLINSMAGITAVAISDDAFDVINRSVKLSMSLGGAFDITIGPLMEAWNFSLRSRRAPPPPAEIEKAKALVNYKNVHIDPDIKAVKLMKREMKLDLGAVGKGYAAAKARNLLVSRGATSALINMRSSISSIGRRADGKPWRVGVRDPRDASKMLGIIELAPGEAVSTTGDYEKYFVVDGKAYHHILDPRTGRPAEGCRSVTIVAADATVADIISTAVFVKGPAEGMRLINSLEGVKGVIVRADGSVLRSAGLKMEDPK